MSATFAKLLLVSLVGLSVIAAPALAVEKHVNCNAGQSIEKAIGTAKGSAAPLVINVTGECDESFTIRRDHVRIVGDPYAHISGTVRIFSSNDVQLFDLTISGPGPGLWVAGSVSVATDGVNLVGNDGTALIVTRNANVWFRNGMIRGNCEHFEDEDCDDGVSVEDASLQLRNTAILQNRYGIIGDVGAHLVLETAGSAITEIADNSVVGVQVSLHSVVDLRGNTRIHDNRYHAIFAAQDSGIRISDSNVDVEGNIGCLDEESSFDNWGGGSITSTDCSGF